MPSPRDLCLLFCMTLEVSVEKTSFVTSAMSHGGLDCTHLAKMRSWSCKLSSSMIGVLQGELNLNHLDFCCNPLAGLRIPEPPNEKQLQALLGSSDWHAHNSVSMCEDSVPACYGLRAVGQHNGALSSPLLKGTACACMVTCLPQALAAAGELSKSQIDLQPRDPVAFAEPGIRPMLSLVMLRCRHPEVRYSFSQSLPAVPQRAFCVYRSEVQKSLASQGPAAGLRT